MIQGISSYHAINTAGVSGSDRPDVRQHNQGRQDPQSAGFGSLLSREADVRVAFSEDARRLARTETPERRDAPGENTGFARTLGEAAGPLRTDTARFSAEALTAQGVQAGRAYEALSRMTPRHEMSPVSSRPTASTEHVLAAYNKTRGETGVALLGTGLSLSV